MKRIVMLLSLVFLLVLCSCSPSIFSHKDQKIVVLVVGLDYTKRYDSIEKLKFKVGINDYYVNKLDASLRDAKEIGAALDSVYQQKNIEHEVIFMLSEGDHPEYESIYYPSSDNVIKTIKNLELDKDDLFVFYFAGHGFSSESELYLLTGDTQYSNNVCTSITSSRLLSTIKSLSCRSVIILDSCFSGAADPDNTLSSESLSFSINNIFKEKFNTESETKLSILCASKWNEESFEDYFVRTSEGTTEEHGQFTGRLLSVLGWNHSSSKTTIVNKDTDNEVVAEGESAGIKWSLSLDDIYLKILDGWTFPSMEQHPVLYYTNESINLIPAN